MTMLTELGAGGSLRVPMTYAEYEALGETLHTEYYDGMVIVNPPTKRHIIIARRLIILLDRHCPAGHEVLQESGWAIRPQTVYIPDLLIARRGAPGPDMLREAPLLVLEITSPSTKSEDLGRKMVDYAKGGAGWYWVVDPQRGTLTTYHNGYGSFTEQRSYSREQVARIAEPLQVNIDLVELFSE